MLPFDEELKKGNDSNTIQIVETELEDEPNHEIPCSLLPEDPSPENISEVSICTALPCFDDLDTSAGYNLPLRHNCGKPPQRYSPDYAKKGSRYPIANYVST